MQTDSRFLFDADAARHDSLTATLRLVRIRRRVRRTVRVACAVALIALPFLLWPRPSTGPTAVSSENARIIRSRPLTDAQKVHSSTPPGLRIRTSPAPEIAVRVRTLPGSTVPRLADAEFRQLLAAHEVGCIEVAGNPARVFPLSVGGSAQGP